MKRRNKSKVGAKLIFFNCISFVAILVFLSFLQQSMTPIINTLALSRAQNLATVTINDTVSEILCEETDFYSALIKTEYDENGNVSSLSTDSVGMNKLKSKISVSITQAIADIEETEISIALGTLTGNPLLTGRGPKIKLNLHLSCTCAIEVGNSFSYSGINQTLHKVMLYVTTHVYVVSVGKTLSADIFTTIPVAETVIIGNIPEIYAGKDDSLWQDLIN